MRKENKIMIKGVSHSYADICDRHMEINKGDGLITMQPHFDGNAARGKSVVLFHTKKIYLANDVRSLDSKLMVFVETETGTQAVILPKRDSHWKKIISP